MLRVVLDTNIIVSALLTDQGLPALILDLAISRRIQLFYSQALMSEYEEVLSRRRFDFPPKKVKKTLAEIKRAGIDIFPTQTIILITEDPKDNRILEASQTAQAHYIITGNRKHFPFQKFKKTRIVSPREFLEREGNLASSADFGLVRHNS
jgi:putative PIN family toxin of toxin-antitoxin system